MTAHDRRPIIHELRDHAPFTALGALSGIVLLLVVVLGHVPTKVSNAAFCVFHPGHVFLSAMVTAAMFWRYRRNVVLTVIIGYVGSIAIGTTSDILLPHLGGWLIGVRMDHVHQHLGFIEEWWLVNPAALLGIAAGMWQGRTKVPHFGHVLLSTWASLFYLVAHGHVENWLPKLPLAFIVLFVAVWLPCCLSDILFPLAFVGRKNAESH